MDINKLPGVWLLALIFALGCSGTGKVGNLRNQSEADSIITQQKLVENWTEYHIWVRSAAIVFDPKNDANTLLIAGRWTAVRDEKSWSEIVGLNTTTSGNISPRFANYKMTPVREVRSPDDQLFGYIMHQVNDSVSARVVDDATIRLFYHRARYGGP